MKRLLLAATTILLISTAAASAFEINCNAPQVLLGEDRGDVNPVVKITVKYSPDDHAWRVFHTLRDGSVVSRSEQYAIVDATNKSRSQWQGSLNRQRNLYMIGDVQRVEGEIIYTEWMYDRSKNNALVMQASARCATPKVTEPKARVKDSVPIYLSNRDTIVMVDVLLGGQPLRMMIDTGATTSVITESVAASIIRAGGGVWEGSNEFAMPDGTVRETRVLIIRELRIGQHIVRNVRAAVSSVEQALLAFPVVNGIAPFTIDTRAGELIWHTNG